MRTIWMVLAIVTFLCLVTTTVGCSRKVVKVAAQPATQVPPDTAVRAAPEPERLDTVGADARAREALQPVYFDFERSALRADARDRLAVAGGFLKEASTLEVLIEGHCDERGSAEYNMALGEKRARTVGEWLIAYGIAPARLETTSYGKERPAVSGCAADELCHQKNRRVEFRVLAR